MALTAGTALYSTSDSFKHHTLAFRRMMLAAEAVVVTGYDYKFSLGYGNRDLKPGDPEDEKERRVRKSRLHKRSAERVMRMMRENGGIYIKLGQHLASLKYLLPEEWTRTMEPLQDRCIPSSIESIQGLFLSDLGKPLSEIFSSFDLNPIGVASLAQVHRATLRSNGQEVAVKIQHPALSEFSAIDMRTIAALTEFIAYAFPEFEFFWLSEEIQANLPKELDFRYEAKNSARTATNFDRAREQGSPSTVKVPIVYWAQKRVMAMEFMNGSRIDDVEYLNANNIKVADVSKEMARTFSQMIYKDGFLHCDPHPGNVMIRPKPVGSPSHCNFEIILLDHGLYRELSPEFRLDYARLWTAVMASDQEEIKKRALKLGGIDAYELFACILTGRDWDVIQDAQLTKKVRNKEETSKISHDAGNWLVEIADILAKVPRDLLLLFKTNDLLRALDEDLGADDGAQMRTFAVMGQYCAQVIFEAEKKDIQHNLVVAAANSSTSVVSMSVLVRNVAAWIKAYWRCVSKQVSLDLFIWWIDQTQANTVLYRILSMLGLSPL
ncbi:ABC1 family-domain-containing protein [Lobosporangium transversale]|uniref:ABC1 family-domain-containing protein n=1 Tax=Lobosporangium transversale TaxID=64571 RepID=A0A1Y2GVR5_9FUNG|nr:ABC1 family-domain-containing protein [Lobosporangium transversale]ORZ26390.1 ABC1 family-domain-containing protein [Lobosporangium transversale]|eukprot:XP_021884155.1 ABC1 family-domain-containing protein [Lobosporangium transversale]